MHTHCLNCGRKLHTTASQLAGYGPKCIRKIRTAAADTTGYKPDQIAAAMQLIEDIAIIAIRPNRVWATVSTDGQSIHRTARNACTCPAGIRGTNCYHRAAVAILTH